MSNKKRLVTKFKKEYIKLVCIVKFDKLLHELAKNIKSIESIKTMIILQDKSNMRTTTLLAKSNMSLPILNDMGVIIPDPNTMKSNDMAS